MLGIGTDVTAKGGSFATRSVRTARQWMRFEPQRADG